MLAPIFQCAACDTIFVQPNVRHYLGQVVEVCPLCRAESLDWDHMEEATVSIEFIAIIGDNFTETRRMNLRCIAEGTMAPWNPLARGL